MSGVSLPTLYLIRHGETEWTLSGQHSGIADVPLNPHGEGMARVLAPFLARIPFAHVLTSPRQRARRTCELALGDRPAMIEPDLAEWDYGCYDGMRTAEIHERNPAWNVFHDGCPGGESLGQAESRASRLLGRLKRLQGPLALFTHGQFGCMLAASWMGLPGHEGEHFAMDPASISVLGPKPGHASVPVIVRWNMPFALIARDGNSIETRRPCAAAN